LRYQLKDSQPKTVLISDSANTDELDKLTWSKIMMSDVLSLKRDHNYRPIDEFDEQQVAAIFYTPDVAKHDTGVILTYGNYFYSAIGTALNLGINKQDSWVLSLPLFNVPGFIIIMRSLIYGISVYLIDGFDIEHINKVLINEHATLFH
jgi:Acyl-CoA synthetases (AMP-forming)/AMP-acid ligases II